MIATQTSCKQEQRKKYFKEWYSLIDWKIFESTTKQVKYLYEKAPCEPSYKDIFKVFTVTPLKELKVVMLGQDPYFQKGVATGIAFGNCNSAKNKSASLKILKEAAINFEIPHNCITFDNSLESWCKQGVLLLNSALSVEVNKPTSHTAVWREFIISLLKNISLYNPGLIYVLWGNEAKKFKKYICSYAKILEMPHPSYYARSGKKLDSTFFLELNKIINFYFKQKINWYEEVLY